jgi:alpha-L-fucosidase
MTMNESWGYNAGDDRWKAPETLLRQLASVAAQDGNYLLNLGPRPDGSIPMPSLERLRDIGRWMERHGAAVRGTRGGPFPHRLPWGDATRRGDDLFLLVDRWPEDGRLVVPLLDLPVAARLTEDSAPLPCRLVPGGIEIAVPRGAPDPAVSVVHLTFNGAPRLGAVPPLPKPPAVVQPVDGSLVLGAADCEIIGDHLALSSGQPPQLGCWTSLDSHPLWRVRLQRGGSFAVSLVYGVPAHRQGTLADVEIGAARLPFVAGGTGGWDEFVVAPVGTVELAAPGEIEVRVQPRNIPVGAVMNLREVRLVPL